MLFLTVLQNYYVVHTKSTMQALFHAEEGADTFSINFMDENDGQDGLYFSVDAEIIRDPNDASSFGVQDLAGYTIQFSAFTPAPLVETEDADDAIGVDDEA